MKGSPSVSLKLLQANLELSQVNITNLFVGYNKYSHYRSWRATGGSGVISFSYDDLEEMSRYSNSIFTNNLHVWQNEYTRTDEFFCKYAPIVIYCYRLEQGRLSSLSLSSLLHI